MTDEWRFVTDHIVEIILGIIAFISPFAYEKFGIESLYYILLISTFIICLIYIIKQHFIIKQKEKELSETRVEMDIKKKNKEIVINKLFEKNVTNAIDILISKNIDRRDYQTEFENNQTIDILAISDKQFNFCLLDYDNYQKAQKITKDGPGKPLVNYDNISYVRQKITIPIGGEWFFCLSHDGCIIDDIVINLIISKL